MKRVAATFAIAGLSFLLLPAIAAAQCEGGTFVAGYYLRDGTYVPGHCADTNPTTPGQLYPSGAQPMVSTNPATGASRLPGQVYASGSLPVNSSDLGPAPSYVSANPVRGGLPSAGMSLGPGANLPGMTGTSLAAVAPGSVAGLPGQFPQTGVPALTGNRAVPSALTEASPTGEAAVTSPISSLAFTNTAYSFTLPAAPPREAEVVPQPTASADGSASAAGDEPASVVVVAYPR